jgi:hypothetical protein
MKRLTAGTLALAAAGAMGVVWTAGGVAASDKKDIVIGEQCDRTGPTQLVGISLCPAILDYINLVNSKGGVEGYKIKLEEIDNEYKVPPAIEAYEKDPRHLARLRHRGGRQRHALSLPVPGRGDLLVASSGGCSVYQGQARRQPGRQEDRLSLLRQSRRP